MGRIFIAFVFGAALLTACAGWQEPSGREERVREVSATVTALDLAERSIGLELEGGEILLVAGEAAVPDLGRFKVGDDVVVAYRQTLAWRVRPAGKPSPVPGGQETEAGAAAGADGPAVPARRRLSFTANIIALDREAGTVTLSGLQGDERVFKSSRPGELKHMEVGDLVDITYDEAVTVTAKPAGK
jgi:hypothetical protein